MAELHDRMPVILAENDWLKWLSEEMLKPCADEVLRVWPVNKMVGTVRNTGRDLVLPI